MLKDVFELSLEEIAGDARDDGGRREGGASPRARQAAEEPAPEAATAPVPGALDAFCAAFNAGDLERLTALLLDSAVVEVVGATTQYGPEAARRTVLFGMLFGFKRLADPEGARDFDARFAEGALPERRRASRRACIAAAGSCSTGTSTSTEKRSARSRRSSSTAIASRVSRTTSTTRIPRRHRRRARRSRPQSTAIAGGSRRCSHEAGNVFGRRDCGALAQAPVSAAAAETATPPETATAPATAMDKAGYARVNGLRMYVRGARQRPAAAALARRRLNRPDLVRRDHAGARAGSPRDRPRTTGPRAQRRPRGRALVRTDGRRHGGAPRPARSASGGRARVLERRHRGDAARDPAPAARPPPDPLLSFYARAGMPPQFWQGFAQATMADMPAPLRTAFTPPPRPRRGACPVREAGRPHASFRDLPEASLRTITAKSLRHDRRPRRHVRRARHAVVAALAPRRARGHARLGARDVPRRRRRRPARLRLTDLRATMIDAFLADRL